MTLRKTIEDGLEDFLRYLFFWTSDFGAAVVTLHKVLIVGFIALFILSYAYRPVLYICFGITLLITMQHLILGTCVLSSIERHANGTALRVLEPSLGLLGLPETKDNLRYLTQTLFVLLSLMLLVRIYHK
jgi:hypothetical protein